ncbi:MAG: hypothetical protein SFU99_09210 [Saprospiraceae bacterium]|nr:hypothetical protein [Saprospiraceae bacterium]
MKFSTNLSSQRILNWIFWILLIASLLPLWVNPYFLTGDGPCHLYNAKVWWDIIHRHEYNFFNHYLYLNPNLEPNYSTHFFMGLLMQIMPAVFAEKILLTIYIILFAVGLRFAIRQIEPKSEWVAILGFPMIYHHVFQMGFYNFSLSLALAFWIIGAWLKWQNTWTDAQKLWFALLNLLCFFTHPVGLLIGISSVGLLFLTENTGLLLSDFKKFIRKAGTLILSLLPTLILIVAYLYRKPGATIEGKEPFAQLIKEFSGFTSLIALSSKEVALAQGMAILLGILFLASLVLRLQNLLLRKSDIFFLIFLFWVLFYFFAPAGFAGAGVLAIRLQIIPFLMLLLWLGSIEWNNILKWGGIGIGAFIALALLTIRMPIYNKLSNAIEDMMSLEPYLEDKKTVLNLTYSLNGKTPEGEWIADRIWLFLHAADYIATKKAVVMLPNYEACTYNFPLIWRWDREPFSQIGNLEAIPPKANFLDYPQRTNGQVDYVLVWFLDSEWQDHPDTQNITNQLSQGYELVKTSPKGLAKLYRRKAGI